MSRAGRILVAGGSAAERTRLVGLVRDAGFPVVADAEDPAAAADDRPVILVVVAGARAHDACLTVRRSPRLETVPILAVVPRRELEEAAAIAAGADDVLRDPVSASHLAHRIGALLRAGADRESLRVARLCEETVLEVLALFTGEGELIESLREVLERVAAVLGYERAVVVLVGDASDVTCVLCASDDPAVNRLPVELEDYPEARLAIQGRAPVHADDVTADPRLREDAAALVARGVRAVAAFPLEWRGRAKGAVLCRSPVPRTLPLDERRVALGRIVGGILEQRIGDGQVLDAVREQTHRISLVRYESERRSRAIEQLRDYLEAASDGIVAVDGDGIVLFVNRAAQTITGFAGSGLIGTPLGRLVAEPHAAILEDVIVQVLGGTNLEAFDLALQTTTGETICVSVTTSTVLSEHGAAMLSFRDVTAQRELETELRKTKEFLEKLIDSAVDAIVVADLDGRVMIYNRGAERLFGWTAEEAVGELSVERLYPEGVARQIMRMLRSASAGGVGRLELTRREISTKGGEVVPVNMTASVVYEDGREVATVGILSDLRDRIRIEQRLLQAQEKLVLSQKQALVAELAGAAAHELNQPLTSVMGYAELLKKRMASDDPHFRAIDTIHREAERMAEIVRKIGRITRFETKAYVGSAQILDLERSAGHGLPEPAAGDDEPARNGDGRPRR